jgi:hypothetical protein
MPNFVEASPIFSTFALRSLKSKAGLFFYTFSGDIHRMEIINV